MISICLLPSKYHNSEYNEITILQFHMTLASKKLINFHFSEIQMVHKRKMLYHRSQ